MVTRSDPRSRKRRKWGVIVPVAIPLISTVGVVVWRAMLDPVAYGGGDVTVAGGGWLQRDAWVYERAGMDTDVRVPWKGWAHPVFASDELVDACRPRLVVSADGAMTFALHLSAGSAIAFVRREVGFGDSVAVTGERGGAMRGIAPLYLGVGHRVIGETTPTAGRWAGVAIVRPSRR